MAKDLLVYFDRQPCYEIKIRNNFRDFLSSMQGNLIQKKYGKVCIVTDSQVAELYLDEVQELCKSTFNKVCSFVFSNGEASKHLGTVESIYQLLIENRFDRGDLLIALGGGVVGDVCGFTAATYLRGIDFIQIPTTLLSQVDSSIGGKTGVDFQQYKNMVGAFYMPKLVYMNTSVLQTLPREQFQSGMGEVIKHGLIKDIDYFYWLNSHRDEICHLQADVLEQMIYSSCMIKKQVVEDDPKELSIRAHLNFGHTIGHAVEKLSDLKMFHGQCVSVGMVCAAYLSYRKRMISQEDYENIRKMIVSFGLPVTVSGLSAENILAATKSDKKMSEGRIKFVVLNPVGNADLYCDFSDEELLDGISVIL